MAISRGRSGKGQYRAVLVVAGNRITEEYIPNTCAALAVAGFTALRSEHLSYGPGHGAYAG